MDVSVVCGGAFLAFITNWTHSVPGLCEPRAAIYVCLLRGEDGDSYPASHFFADANSVWEGNATI